MKKARRKNILTADYSAALTDLPLAELRARGVKVLAFDLDRTLALRRTRRVTADYAQYLAGLRARGFRLLLASNALSDLSGLAEELGVSVVQATFWVRKPFSGYFRRLVATAGCPPAQIAMVGDNVFTDVLGANRAGLVTVRVARLRP